MSLWGLKSLSCLWPHFVQQHQRQSEYWHLKASSFSSDFFHRVIDFPQNVQPRWSRDQIHLSSFVRDRYHSWIFLSDTLPLSLVLLYKVIINRQAPSAHSFALRSPSITGWAPAKSSSCSCGCGREHKAGGKWKDVCAQRADQRFGRFFEREREGDMATVKPVSSLNHVRIMWLQSNSEAFKAHEMKRPTSIVHGHQVLHPSAQTDTVQLNQNESVIHFCANFNLETTQIWMGVVVDRPRDLCHHALCLCEEVIVSNRLDTN